eukprot:SAG22_NODE_437_length_10501_cov_3.019804_7_plen_124_part_00
MNRSGGARGARRGERKEGTGQAGRKGGGGGGGGGGVSHRVRRFRYGWARAVPENRPGLQGADDQGADIRPRHVDGGAVPSLCGEELGGICGGGWARERTTSNEWGARKAQSSFAVAMPSCQAY